MKKFLAVGVNHFLIPGNNLAGCVPDEQAMSKVAKDIGFDEIVGMQDSQATKFNVLSVLKALIGGVSLSYLGFSWSGHGTHYPRPEEPDGLGEALVCYDIAEKNGDWDPDTIIKDKELRDLLNQVSSTCIVEVWFDTCYSGGMDRNFLSAHGSTTNPKSMPNPSNPGQMMRVANSNFGPGLNSNIIMWCASSEAQTSADAYISGGAHGAFTYFWVQEWKKNPKLSRVELLVKTRAALQVNGYAQVPRLKCWNKAAQVPVGA